MVNHPLRILRIFLFLVLFGVLFSLGQGGSLARSEVVLQEQDLILAPETPEAPDAGVQVSLVGQTGGGTYAVATRFIDPKTYAYIGIGPRLAIIDITDRTRPIRAGLSGVLPGLIRDIAVPSANYALIAADTAGLRILDISTPSAPVEVAAIKTDDATYGVAVSGNYAYLADGIAGFRAVDITNPEAPVDFLPVKIDGIARDVFILGTKAYVSADNAGFYIFDISKPENPAILGAARTNGPAYGVAVLGVYAFAAIWKEGLEVWQIQDPTRPVRVYSLPLTGGAAGVTLAGDYAFTASYIGGLRMISIVDPTKPVELSSSVTGGEGYAVATASGNYVLLADETKGLRIILYANSPPYLTERPSYDLSSVDSSVAVDGNYAYLAGGQDGVHIINVSDPANPYHYAYYDVPEVVLNVATSGIYGYIANSAAGLHIFDKSNPAAPTFVGSRDTPGSAHDVAITGSTAFVADATSGLQVINVSNPASPGAPTGFDTPGIANGVVTYSNYAYVADGSSGLHVIYKAIPSAPREVGLLDLPGYAYDVAASGAYAYVAEGTSGVSIISIPDYFTGFNEKEPNNTTGEANGMIHSGQVYQGNPGEGDADYFSFTTNLAGTITVDLTNYDPAKGSVMLMGPTLNLVDDNLPYYIEATGQPGTYFVLVDTGAAGSTPAQYSLTVTYDRTLAESGFYNTPGTATGIKGSGSLAYVADGLSGLRIINTVNPTSEAGYFNTAGNAVDVALSGNYAYVADESGGLVVLRLCILPVAPAMVLPANGSTEASDNTPLFDWNMVTNASNYQIQVDNNNDFTTPEASATITNTNYTPASPLPNATYYWRVRAHNTASGCDAWGPYSAPFTVTVAVPPGAFSKVGTANGSLGLSDLVGIGWQASTGATYYEYCVDTSDDNACSSWQNGGNGATSFYYEVGPMYATTFYWQVRACNTICTEANGGSWWSFTTNDQYENDDNKDQARLVTPGTTLHSLYPENEEDWIKFILEREMAVFLETWGTGNWDTEIWLYRLDGSNLTELEYNDNDGVGNYSYIDRACDVDTLQPGTYYVKVRAKGTTTIPVYQLRLSTWGCKVFLPLTFKNFVPYFDGPFEVEDNSVIAKANGPIRSGQAYQGYPNDESDYFYFETNASGNITVDLDNHSGGGVQLLLYYGEPPAQVGLDQSSPYEINYSGAAGKYYVRIYTVSGFNSSTPYELTVTYP